MIRVGGMALIVLALFLLFGCSDKTTGDEETGVAITFPHCVTFNAHVRIDGNNVGSFSSEHEAVIDLAAGAHTLEADAYGFVVAETTYCWTMNFNVTSGKLTEIALDCYGHGCTPP
jgi:hypothetical protein